MDQARSEKPAESPVFGAAIQGGRTEQQDSFRLHWLGDDRAWLLILADGMGGHAGGALASRLVADCFGHKFKSLRVAGSALNHCFDQALVAANEAIATAQKEDGGSAQGMGTTLVAAYLNSTAVCWLSVGDSPLWLYRSGHITRLNEDHSLRHYGNAKQANMLQSAVVGDEITLVDRHYGPVDLRSEDIILVSSDGLLTLPEEQIVSTIRSADTGSAELLAWLLLHAVEDKRKEHQDNCSVIVARPSWIDGGNLATKRTRQRTLVRLGSILGGLLFLICAGAWWYLQSK